MTANYHTVISIRALVANPDSHGPDGHGWHVAKGQLWTSQQPVPSKLLEFVMRMLDRLPKVKVIMSESQSAVHRYVPLQNL